MGSAAAAIIIKKERDLVDHLQQERATSPAAAKSLAALRIEDSLALRRLRERAVIREAAPGTFYLDAPSWEALRRTRHRMVAIMLLIVIVLGVTALIVSRGQVPR